MGMDGLFILSTSVRPGCALFSPESFNAAATFKAITAESAALSAKYPNWCGRVERKESFQHEMLQGG